MSIHYAIIPIIFFSGIYAAIGLYFLILYYRIPDMRSNHVLWFITADYLAMAYNVMRIFKYYATTCDAAYFWVRATHIMIPVLAIAVAGFLNHYALESKKWITRYIILIFSVLAIASLVGGKYVFDKASCSITAVEFMNISLTHIWFWPGPVATALYISLIGSVLYAAFHGLFWGIKVSMKKNKIPVEIPFPLKEKKPSFRTLFHTLFYSNIGLKMKIWENATVVTADIPLNQKETKRILPLFMWPVKPCKITFFMAQYASTAFTGAYNESAILFHVRTPFGKGVHVPWMVVNDDTALIYGRELLGYPKKSADIPFDDDGKKIKTSITRRGIKIASAEAERIAIEANPSPITAIKTFNIGGDGSGICRSSCLDV